MLERLADHNAFIIALDQEGGWYRYHHLYAEFLQKKLDSSGDAVKRTLHEQAGKWFEKNGNFKEAVRQYVLSCSYENAAAIIEAQGRDMLKTGDAETLLKWLYTLPTEVIESRILLSLINAWALVITDSICEAQLWIHKVKSRIANPAAENMAEDWKSQLDGKKTKTLEGTPHLMEPLTKREKDVLHLLDSELANAEIAYTLTSQLTL